MKIPTATRDHPVWLHVGTLLDGASTTPARDAHVVYDATAIRFVGADGRRPPREVLGPGRTQPDAVAPGGTLLPGLIDAHAHLFLEGGELDPDARAAHLRQGAAGLLAGAGSRLEKLVRLGLAGVRDAGDKDGVGLALRRLYMSDQRPVMPYVDSPGAAIHHRGRYGGFMAGPLEDFPSARACVESRLEAGADRIKLIPTGIINFPDGAVTSEPQMTLAEIKEIVAAAREHGRQTFAHASGEAGIERAIEGGVDSVEHGFFVREDQLTRMGDRHIAWVPTFAPVQRQLDHADRMGWSEKIVAHLHRILDGHAASLRKAHALGVPVIAGSDAGSYGVAHGIDFLYELELMERAGLPSLAVINAATGVSAGRLGFTEDFGRIVPGARSRFLVAHHPPLATVANLGKSRLVVFDGTVYETDETLDAKGL